MASITARRNLDKKAEELFKETHFTKDEVASLLRMFEDYAKHEKIDRGTFRDILYYNFGLTEDILMDRVFKVFDEDNDSNINMKEWVCGFSKFLRGTTKEKMDFCFNVYDLNGNGYILREEIHHMLKDCMVKSSTEEDAEENVKELVEIVIKKMDFDHDGKLSPLDYTTAVSKENLLLQAFGKCLPGRQEVDTFTDKYIKTKQS